MNTLIIVLDCLAIISAGVSIWFAISAMRKAREARRLLSTSIEPSILAERWLETVLGPKPTARSSDG